jgi:molybdopterin synthase sulfur carrier subunit
MPVQVLIPTPLQKFTDNQATVSLEADSVQALVGALESRFPGFSKSLCDESQMATR